MIFEWTLWELTPTGKKKLDSGTIKDKKTLAGGKRAATNHAPDSLKKADWRHRFANVYLKEDSKYQLYLRAIPTSKGELPKILHTEAYLKSLRACFRSKMDAENYCTNQEVK